MPRGCATHVVVALGAGALDVAVREEALVFLAVELLVLVLLEPPVVVQLEEDVLADPAYPQSGVSELETRRGEAVRGALGLLRRRSAAKVVKANLEPLVRVGMDLVVCWDHVSSAPWAVNDPAVGSAHLSHSSCGLTPSLAAITSVVVPYSSVPQICPCTGERHRST